MVCSMKYKVGDVVIAKINRFCEIHREKISLKDKIGYISRIDDSVSYSAYHIVFQGMPNKEFWYKGNHLEKMNEISSW